MKKNDFSKSAEQLKTLLGWPNEKIKQLNLMQTKEKLSQRKTISHLVDLKTEAENAEK